MILSRRRRAAPSDLEPRPVPEQLVEVVIEPSGLAVLDELERRVVVLRGVLQLLLPQPSPHTVSTSSLPSAQVSLLDASESGRLRHGDGTHGRSDRRRKVLMLPTL
jgi:hypothetical protein